MQPLASFLEKEKHHKKRVPSTFTSFQETLFCISGPFFTRLQHFLRKNEAELSSVLSKKHFFSPQAIAPTSAYRRANGLSATFGNGHTALFSHRTETDIVKNRMTQCPESASKVLRILYQRAHNISLHDAKSTPKQPYD